MFSLNVFRFQIERLFIGANSIADSTASELANCLHLVKELHVENCQMSEIGIEAMRKALKRDDVVSLKMYTIHSNLNRLK